MPDETDYRSIKSVSPEEIENAIAKALAELTGFSDAQCKINNIEYFGLKDSWVSGLPIAGSAKFSLEINVSRTDPDLVPGV